MNLFENIGLNSQLLGAVNKLGFTKPTQIQEESLPLILQGNDVIGESATGSGKTLAFGCGIINKTEPKQGLQALVLTPTRELTEQVKEALVKLANGKNLNVISIYGGISINPQIKDLHFANVVVSTPGRLLDHIQRRTVDLTKVKVLVLDEVDQMLDMGFIDDVERIIKYLPKQRQTLFFSATVTQFIKSLANKYLINPKNVFAKKFVDQSKLKQTYYNVQKNMKLSLLVHLLKQEKSGLVMVFCNTRRNVDFVVKNLKKNSVEAMAIHGGLTQNKRTRTMDKFNTDKKAHVLVCTDVAARGLDIDDVSHIYNYDLPRDSRDYVHRIGRTARAGEEGKVINLLCEYDHGNFRRIEIDYSEFKIEKIEKPYIERIQGVKNDDENPRRSNWSSQGRFNHNRGRGPRNFSQGNENRLRQEGFRKDQIKRW